MKIKEVEKQVGITSRNIRYYEEEGLINPGRNKDNNYCEYSEADVWLLKRARLLRVLGVSISEIKAINERETSLNDVIRLRMAELQNQQHKIDGMIKICSTIVE